LGQAELLLMAPRAGMAEILILFLVVMFWQKEDWGEKKLLLLAVLAVLAVLVVRGLQHMMVELVGMGKTIILARADLAEVVLEQEALALLVLILGLRQLE
jgi:hypothetical protein